MGSSSSKNSDINEELVKDEDNEIDYLAVDTLSNNMCEKVWVSFMKKNGKVVGIKIRGSEEEQDLLDVDPQFSIYSIPVGYWTPIDDSIDEAMLNKIAKEAGCKPV